MVVILGHQVYTIELMEEAECLVILMGAGLIIPHMLIFLFTQELIQLPLSGWLITGELICGTMQIQKQRYTTVNFKVYVTNNFGSGNVIIDGTPKHQILINLLKSGE